MARKSAYYQVTDGEWIEPTRIHKEQCCDCALVHKTEYRVVNGRIQYRVWRDARATAAARRAFKFEGDDEKA